MCARSLPTCIRPRSAQRGLNRTDSFATFDLALGTAFQGLIPEVTDSTERSPSQEHYLELEKLNPR